MEDREEYLIAADLRVGRENSEKTMPAKPRFDMKSLLAATTVACLWLSCFAAISNRETVRSLFPRTYSPIDGATFFLIFMALWALPAILLTGYLVVRHSPGDTPAINTLAFFLIAILVPFFVCCYLYAS